MTNRHTKKNVGFSNARINNTDVSVSIHEVVFTIPYEPSDRLYIKGVEKQVLDIASRVLGERLYRLSGNYAFGRKGYRMAVSLVGEGFIQWASTRADMGINVRITGTMCESVSLEYLVLVVRRVCDMGGHIARLDIAFDVLNLFTIQDFFPQAYKGFGEHRRDMSEQINHKRGGRTLYVGGRKNTRMLVRVYDKAATERIKKRDLPEGVDIWTRWELETHRNVSRAYGKTIGKELSLSAVVADIKARYPCILWYCRSVYDVEPRKMDISPVKKYIWSMYVFGAYFLSVVDEWGLDNFVNEWNERASLSAMPTRNRRLSVVDSLVQEEAYNFPDKEGAEKNYVRARQTKEVKEIRKHIGGG